MLSPSTMIKTNKGILQVRHLIIGMRVETGTGLAFVTGNKLLSVGVFKHRITLLDGSSVIFGTHLMLFSGGEQRLATKFKVGDFIDTVNGPREIAKYTDIYSKTRMSRVIVTSYLSKFSLANGILVAPRYV